MDYAHRWSNMELTQLFKYSKLYQISSSLYVHMEATYDKSQTCIFMQSTSSFQRGLSNPRKKFLSGSHLLVNIFAMPVRNPSHTSPLLCKLYSIHTYGVWRKTPAVCYLRPLTWEKTNKQTKHFHQFEPFSFLSGISKRGGMMTQLPSVRVLFYARNHRICGQWKRATFFRGLKIKKFFRKIAQDPRRTNGGEKTE